MTQTPTPSLDASTRSGAGGMKAWWQGLLIASAMLSLLGFLLARLIMLPFLLGLFFYLIAGMISGALAFRRARDSRPVRSRTILFGCVLASIFATTVITYFEYEYIVQTIGAEPRFAEARNEAMAQGRPSREVTAQAGDSFRERLRSEYPPGRMFGYVRWMVAGGKMNLSVASHAEPVSVQHGGWLWPIRTLAGAILIAIGLWFSFEALRSPTPVSNILLPGETYESLDD
jgi:hypothetical protein